MTIMAGISEAAARQNSIGPSRPRRIQRGRGRGDFNETLASAEFSAAGEREGVSAAARQDVFNGKAAKPKNRSLCGAKPRPA